MSHPAHLPRFLSFRRLWKPVVLTGAGGTAVVLWIDEILMFGEEILALIFLPILAGTIFLLDILFFKSHIPRREDLNPSTKKGEPK